MKASDIRDELKHIRLIHFTLTTLCGVMLYFVIAAWSVPPQIYPELLGLKDFLGRLQTGDVVLREVDQHGAAQAKDQILKRLQQLISPKLEWVLLGSEPAFNCARAAAQVDLQKSSISEMIDRAASEPCKLLMPDQIEGNVADAQVWIKDSLQFRYGTLTAGPDLIGFALGADARPGPGNTARVILRIIHQPVPCSRDGDCAPAIVDDKEVKLATMLSMRSYDFPKDWLKERFPDVLAYRDVIGNKPLGDALVWAREQRTKELNSLKVAVLGVDVKSTHIGGVGPLVIGAMLFYLLAYLRHCVTIMPEKANTLQESVKSVSPWLGAQHSLGRLITFLTVACLPACVTILSLYRLLGWTLAWSVVLGILTFLLGALSVLSGYRLGERKVEDALALSARAL